MNILPNTKLSLGSEIILNSLINEGVKQIFGYPGGCVIPLFDALLNYPEIDFFLVRHEQAATHAADGLARVTGKAQVVFATSGPGATNCLTGIATALLDSVPMVVITGQVKRKVIGMDAFQEINVIGLTRPITKYNYLVTDIKDLQYIIKEAFFIANTGRKGPVVIDIPVDVQKEYFAMTTSNAPVNIPGYQTSFPADKLLVHKAWQMLKEAKRPVIYAGNGINNMFASQLIKQFVELTTIPIATTLLGQGIYSEDFQLGLGMLGMHGTYVANKSMNACDLCLVIGARFDDRVTGDPDKFLKQAKIIHVDLDDRSLGKIKKPDLSILADGSEFLTEIIKIMSPLNLTVWNNELKKDKAEKAANNYINYDSADGKIRPEYILNQLSEITSGEAYIVSDVGQHQMFTALHYKFKRPTSHITSGGLGTMGFSLPAAMGIATCFDDYPIISISGDGGFQMNVQELATIRSYNLNVKIFIFNNQNLGMVKQWQDFFWKSRYASTVFNYNPNFASIAASYDIPAEIVFKKESVRDSIIKALKIDGPYLIEFKIDENAHVFPMIPGGASFADIILADN